jgi:hypothetical protein
VEVELTAENVETLTSRLTFPSAQMQLNLESLLQAAEAAKAEGGQGKLLYSNASLHEDHQGPDQRKAPLAAVSGAGNSQVGRRGNQPLTGNDGSRTAALSGAISTSKDAKETSKGGQGSESPSSNSGLAQRQLLSKPALQPQPGNQNETLQRELLDAGPLTGPVNQPTLFGSSIKAQN